MANVELLIEEPWYFSLVLYTTISLFAQAIARLGFLTCVQFLRLFCRAANVQFSLLIPNSCWF